MKNIKLDGEEMVSRLDYLYWKREELEDWFGEPLDDDDELNLEIDFWEEELAKLSNKAVAEIKTIVGYDCLLDGVFVPNMEDSYRPMTMRERFYSEEPDVFDKEISYDVMLDWIRG